MADINKNENNALAPQAPSELDILKERAKVMGITHSNNITVETLKAKIQAKLNDEPEVPEKDSDEANEQVINPLESNADVTVPSRPKTLREQIIEEQTKLVRCRITNLDPKKKDLPGEILTVANEYMGTIRKYVPYGEATDNGYHIPFCIYQMLKDRKFVSITTKRDPRTGHIQTNTRDVAEFSIDVLPPLTAEELHDLAQAQIAAGSVG